MATGHPVGTAPYRYLCPDDDNKRWRLSCHDTFEKRMGEEQLVASIASPGNTTPGGGSGGGSGSSAPIETIYAPESGYVWGQPLETNDFVDMFSKERIVFRKQTPPREVTIAVGAGGGSGEPTAGGGDGALAPLNEAEVAMLEKARLAAEKEKKQREDLRKMDETTFKSVFKLERGMAGFLGRGCSGTVLKVELRASRSPDALLPDGFRICS